MATKGQVNICFGKIRSFCELNNYNEDTQKLLDKFLGNLLQRRRTPTSLEMDLKLETLHKISKSNNSTAQQSILRTIENGWATFYPVYGNNKQIDNIPKTTPISPQKKQKKLNLTDEEF